ncbi:MAG: hypothetical protein JST30_03765 [Armatimonadetes bacterium]|nr:hypothetical protein [Armatimonadota bacterium]
MSFASSRTAMRVSRLAQLTMISMLRGLDSPVDGRSDDLGLDLLLNENLFVRSQRGGAARSSTPAELRDARDSTVPAGTAKAFVYAAGSKENQT